MKPRFPKNKKDFVRYLRDVFDDLQTAHVSDLFEEMSLADLIEEVCVMACRFGGGHLINPHHHIMKTREALAVVGRLLAWAENQMPESELLTVAEVAVMLGISTRTAWCRVSAGGLPKPIQMGGLTKWRRADIEEFING